MPNTKFTRAVSIAALVATSSVLFGCADDDAIAGADVVREGGVTFAELSAVLAATPDDWAWAGGQIDAPKVDDTVLPKDSAFTFTWHADATSTTTAGTPSADEMTFLLVFSTPSEPRLVRVFTTATAYTPDVAAWNKLVGAGEAISVSLTTTTFEDGALTQNGGPHEGETRRFTVR